MSETRCYVFRFENLPIYSQFWSTKSVNKWEISNRDRWRPRHHERTVGFFAACKYVCGRDRCKSRQKWEWQWVNIRVCCFLAIDRFRIENNTLFVRASFFSSFLSIVGMYLVLFLSFSFLFSRDISQWFFFFTRVIFRMGKRVDSNSIGQDADRSRVIFLLNRLQTLYL